MQPVTELIFFCASFALASTLSTQQADTKLMMRRMGKAELVETGITMRRNREMARPELQASLGDQDVLNSLSKEKAERMRAMIAMEKVGAESEPTSRANDVEHHCENDGFFYVHALRIDDGLAANFCEQACAHRKMTGGNFATDPCTADKWKNEPQNHMYKEYGMSCGRCANQDDSDGAKFSHFQHNVWSLTFHEPDASNAALSAQGDPVISTIPTEYTNCTQMYMIDLQDDMCVEYCADSFGLNEQNTNGFGMGACQNATVPPEVTPKYTAFVGYKRLSVFTSTTEHIPHVYLGHVAKHHGH